MRDRAASTVFGSNILGVTFGEHVVGTPGWVKRVCLRLLWSQQPRWSARLSILKNGMTHDNYERQTV
jgi:hypothetical protein